MKRTKYKAGEESDQILPDSQVFIPASEEWLYRHREAIDAVRRGLQEALDGKAVPAGSFVAYADQE